MENIEKNSAVGESDSGFTTVVVDAQVRALCRCDHSLALANGARLIRHARLLNQPVVFLRMKTSWPDNPVVPELMQEVTSPSKYDRFVEVNKIHVGGGDEVRDACGSLFPTKKLVVFGYWLKGCVHKTVCELAWHYPDAEIIIVVDACNEENTEFESLFEHLPNVKLSSIDELCLTA